MSMQQKIAERPGIEKNCRKLLYIFLSIYAMGYKSGWKALLKVSRSGMLSCTALAVYIPTTFEFEEYCGKTLHTMCPYYMKRNAEPNPDSRRASQACKK